MSLGQRTAIIQAERQAELNRRLRRGEGRGREIPSRWAGGAAAPVRRLVIVGGNTLATGQAGIKYTATPITDAPSAYDPAVITSYADYFGRGILWLDGVSQGYVLVINDGGGGTSVNFDLLGGATDADVGSPVVATATLTVGGDPNTTITAYRIDSLVG